MNDHDKPRSKCRDKERDLAWYTKYTPELFLRRSEPKREGDGEAEPKDSVQNTPTNSQTLSDSQLLDSQLETIAADDDKTCRTERDEILTRLLTLQTPKALKKKLKEDGRTSANRWISKYHFHDSMMKEACQEMSI